LDSQKRSSERVDAVNNADIFDGDTEAHAEWPRI